MADFFGKGGYGATGVSIAGDLLSGFSSFQAGKAEAKGYTAAAGYARSNAALSEQATSLDVLRKQRQAYQQIGGAYADVGASGLAMSGSALDVIGSSRANASLDIALMKKKGQMDVNDWLAKATGYEGQASAAKATGAGKGIGGILGAVSSIFSFI